MRSLILIAIILELLIQGHKVQAKYLPTDRWTPETEHPELQALTPSNINTKRNALVKTTQRCYVCIWQHWHIHRPVIINIEVQDKDGSILGQTVTSRNAPLQAVKVEWNRKCDRMTIIPGPERESPMDIKYKGQRWSTNETPKCWTGPYDGEEWMEVGASTPRVRQLRCEFFC